MNWKNFDPEQEFDEVTEELWQYVYNRDDGICQVTGKEGIEVHHIIYRSHGGKHKANNLILLSKEAHFKEHNVKAVDKEYYFERIKINEKRFKRSLV